MKPCLIEVWKDGGEPFFINMNNVICIKKDTISRNASTILTGTNNESFRVKQTIEEIMASVEAACVNSLCLT